MTKLAGLCILGILIGYAIASVVYDSLHRPTVFVIAYLNEAGDVELLHHRAHSYTMNFGCAVFDNGGTICRVLLIHPEVGGNDD